MDGQLLQLGGSLLAILVLAAITWMLKLGQPRTIDTDERACALAREADTAFEPTQAAIGRDGSTAILADSAGRIMVLRRHGTHFAARVLEPGTPAHSEGDILTIMPRDRRYGPVVLDLGPDAQDWALRIDALERVDHA
jgi:hypothetical protein|tara:strand:+ start:1828 stop:2241 length:414 start_codon:yes stop_codon:yes gene_type:complete